jgi:hypothetical protein
MNMVPIKEIDGKVRYQCLYCKKWLAVCTIQRHMTGQCPQHDETLE